MSLCHDPNALHTKIFNKYSICRSENVSKDCISYVINNHKDQDVPEQMLREHLVKMDKYIVMKQKQIHLKVILKIITKA